MYARSLDGEVLTLGVSGALWRDALVMFDRASGSLFSQVDGRALRGAHEGRAMEEIPSVVTTWGD